MKVGIAVSTLVLFCLSLFSAGHSVQAQTIPWFAFGTNASYSPVTGEYSGTGYGFPMGFHYFTGTAVTTPTDNPLVFNWENPEPQITFGILGSILLEAEGQVELTPVDKTHFTARWTADFTVVGGTGLFANVQPSYRPLKVVAVNDPFALDDPIWTFSWTIIGRVRLFQG